MGVPQLNVAKDLIDGLSHEGLSGVQIRELFATFLLLRWAELCELDEEAAAIFEGRPFRSCLPASLRSERWHTCFAEELAKRILPALSQHLETLKFSRENLLWNYLCVLAEPMRRIASTPSLHIGEAILWLVSQPQETSKERRDLSTVFDELVIKRSRARDGTAEGGEALWTLTAALANPQANERVYDPCFGTSGMLAAAWRHSIKVSASSFASALQVFGVDPDRDRVLVGMTRLALAGVRYPHLVQGNGLERDGFPSSGEQVFDVVLANPPFGARTRHENWRYEHFAVLTSDAVGLYVQHAISHLKPQGRAVIVVPESFLFRGGADQILRRQLVESGQIEGVISLPAGVFLPYSGLKVSLLLLRKAGNLSRVRMIDGTRLLEPGRSKRRSPLEPDIARILQALRSDEWPHASPIAWNVSKEELAAIEWDLQAHRRERNDLKQHALAVISSLKDHAARVAALSECAEVITGRALQTADLAELPDSVHTAGYVRIKDVRNGAANECSGWIHDVAFESIDPRRRLQLSDVLFSKSGTIGKVGTVGQGAAGAVAAHSLYVLRTDQSKVYPAYLAAYLQSPTCQSWLAAQSRGSVIQHLNLDILKQVPVVLPSLELQRLAATQFREFQTDVFAFMMDVAGSAEQGRVLSWLREIKGKLPELIDGLPEAPSLNWLDPIVEQAFKAEPPAAEEMDSRHVSWLSPLVDGLLTLRDVGQIPAGSSLLTVLQDAERKFQMSEARCAGHLPVETLGRDIAGKLGHWMHKAYSALQSFTRITVTSHLSQLQSGASVEAPIQIANGGSLPLRMLAVESSPNWGEAHAAFLAEGESLPFVLRGEAPKVLGDLTVSLRWRAITLDGRNVDGAIELAFDVVEGPVDRFDAADLGGSPYITGTPISPDRTGVFYGRRDLLDKIRRQILRCGNVVLLEGNRRSGKTSILKHLEGVSAVPGWLAVYSSFQAAEGARKTEGIPTAEVFREIAKSIASALAQTRIPTPLPDGNVIAPGASRRGLYDACRRGISEAAPFNGFRSYLETVLELLSEHEQGLLLMLDEFDKLQEGIDREVTSPQVPENIRYLLHEYPKLSAILTGQQRLRRLRKEHWSALYGLGTSMSVTALDEQSAHRLVTEPVMGKLIYSPEAADRIVELSARQPYLLQCLCNQVFELAASTKLRSITLDAVEAAAATLLQDNHHFESLWVDARTFRRRLILMLSAAQREPASFRSFSELNERLVQLGVEVDEQILESDLDNLRELELIELVGPMGEGRYRLNIPLMGAWIAHQKDLNLVLNCARTEAEEEDV